MSNRTDLNIFIASSGELDAERVESLKVIVELNKQFKHLHIEPQLFELDTASGNNPGMPRIQDKINTYLDKSEIVVVLFYSKIGEFTKEEFDRAKADNKKLFLYLKDGFHTTNVYEHKKYGEILDLKSAIEKESEIRYQQFNSITDFNGLLYKDLNKHIGENYPAPNDLVTPIDVIPSVVSENKLNLYPTPKKYFIGREKEIEDFRKAIEDGNTFITIDGPGGIGKTQFVSRCIEQFIPKEKIIWFDCTRASQLETLISEAGYPELIKGSNKTDRDKFSAFKDKLQDNEQFLFLDNFENTNNTTVFEEFLKFIQDYLKKGCVIVIDRDNIRTVNLTPTRIHIEGFKENKLDYAKSLIFHCYNTVNIDDTELAKLCEELQGYPLAIDFAIYLLSQGEKSTDIISKIVLDGEAKDISERLLNAIFSRPDATEEERDFMRQFSVFTGIVNEKAVKAVITEKITSTATRKLQKKNLLFYSSEHYEIHPLVREFCYKELKDKEIVHEKVAEYYILQREFEILNPALEEQIFYHLEKAKQWDRIEREIEEKGKQFILLGQLGLVKELLNKLQDIGITKPILNIFYGDIAEIQGKWDEAQKYYNLLRTNNLEDKFKAEGIIKYGEMLHRRGNLKEALQFYNEAYEFANTNNFVTEKGMALNDIGLVYNFWGDLLVALDYHERSLKINEEIGNKEGIAACYGNIGDIYNTQGDLNKALNYLERGLKIKEEIGNKVGIASSYGNIGNIYSTQGDLVKALDFHKRSLKIDEEIGNKEGIAACYGNIGGLIYTQGDMARALDFHERSLKIQEEIGNKEGIAASYSNIGSIYKTQGDLNKALDYHERSLKIKEEIGNKEGIATSNGNIGIVYSAQGDLVKALNFHKKSLKINEEIGNKEGIAASLSNIGSIYGTQEQLIKALEYHERSLKIKEEIGSKQGIATSYNNIGSIYNNQGDLEKALDYHLKSLKLKEEIGNKEGIAASLINIGVFYLKNKKEDTAIDYFFRSLAINNGMNCYEGKKSANSWILEMRNEMGLVKFKELAQQKFSKLTLDEQNNISMQEILNEPIQRLEPKIGRNDICPCGSGKKYKKCHGKDL